MALQRMIENGTGFENRILAQAVDEVPCSGGVSSRGRFLTVALQLEVL